jgi:hypothetical protein
MAKLGTEISIICSMFCRDVTENDDGTRTILDHGNTVIVPPGAVPPIKYLLEFGGGGDSRRKVFVEIERVSPSGKVDREQFGARTLHAEQGQATITIHEPFDELEEGVWWFRVFLNGKMRTETPIAVRYPAAEFDA